jgi:hypothetical protein
MQELRATHPRATGELITGASQSGISPHEKSRPASSMKDFFVTFQNEESDQEQFLLRKRI